MTATLSKADIERLSKGGGGGSGGSLIIPSDVFVEATDGTAKNLTIDGGTATNLNTTDGTATNITITGGSATNLNTTDGTATNITITGGFATNFNTTDGTATNITITGGSATNFNTTDGTATDLTIKGGSATNLNTTNGTATNLTMSGGTLEGTINMNEPSKVAITSGSNNIYLSTLIARTQQLEETNGYGKNTFGLYYYPKEADGTSSSQVQSVSSLFRQSLSRRRRSDL